MVVEKYQSRPTSNDPGGRRTLANGKPIISMFESVYEANLLKKTYEATNNFTYDWVVRIRPDIVFNIAKNLRTDISEVGGDRVIKFGAHHQGRNYDSVVEDIFWIGSSYVMDQVCEFGHIRANSNEGRDWQEHLGIYIKQGLGFGCTPFSNNTMRIYYTKDRVANTDVLTAI
jgi:hypothetical protein